MRQFPELVAEALMLEHQSPSLNPRGTLYRGHTLLSIITNNHHIEALRHFRMRLEAAKYALYRVRRIYKAPGHADRAVEKLMTGSRAEMNACFEHVTSGLEARAEQDIRYGYVRERESGRSPAVEEFLVVTPAAVDSKTRYGFEWFEAKWKEMLRQSNLELELERLEDEYVPEMREGGLSGPALSQSFEIKTDQDVQTPVNPSDSLGDLPF